ncbi:unnamed protein product [Calicophoron daubneyi]|uniref:Presequence protease, mitochondrial n=1 Tax=Calicophoron daubneyi TaxID=300641 RepID=A0AAV2T621_CALDB
MSNQIRHLGVSKLLHGFKLRRSFEVHEFRLLAAELEHVKTGAKYWHLKRDDPNKTFSVQFRTTPRDDTGMSHILEHTTLCGSKKYPVRDPFFKMLHRSQANFMNALTANDWTMYPFSTMNEVDFQNLFQVYTDAVFNPQLTQLDFMQEGWRFEPSTLSDPNSDLQVKGVVYNEMKGVFSNSLNRFGQTVQNKLLPETYGYVSGGLPDCIPNLTWEALKEFHASCYHPSNAVFYTYGDTNLEWCLERLNSDYLEKYEALTLKNSVPLEPLWSEPRTLRLTCEPDPMAPDPDRQCFVCVSYRLDDIQNIYPNFVLGLISKLLVSGDNAPLYRGLIESGFGLDWAGGLCGMDQGGRTTSMHVGLQGVRLKDVDVYAERVRNILSQVVRDGFPKERVEATLHQYELAVRYDSARFGLNLIFGLSHAINHDANVEEALQVQKLIERFKKDLEANPSILQEMVQKYLLDNKHCLISSMNPVPSWQEEQTKKDQELQAQLVAKLTPAEREDCIQKAQQLVAKQQHKEDLSCLPCLQLYDISSDCRLEPFTEGDVLGRSVQLNEAPTNGLVHFHGLADLNELPDELLIYVPLFCDLFPRLGADGLSYLQMDHEIDMHTGGLCASPIVTAKLPSGEDGAGVSTPVRSVHISGYCLEQKVPNFFELWSKLFRAPTWNDTKRLITLILMSASGEWSANAIADSAHRFAIRRAAANLSPTLRTAELWSGLEQAMLVKQIATNLGSEDVKSVAYLDALIDRMTTIWKHIAVCTRFKFSLHGESKGLASGIEGLKQFIPSLSQLASPVSATEPDPAGSPPAVSENSYFIMPYTVHYTGEALPAPACDSPDFPVYRVLAQLLTSKYLHREIREKGGAYGGRATVQPEAILFYSYRDPHARQTLKTFDESLIWAQSAEFTPQDINEAKLAVFQELDQPVSAGSRGLTNFLYGISDDLRQAQRTRLFAVEASDVRAVAVKLANETSCGRTVLGPEKSSDWTTAEGENRPSWERVTISE